MRFLATIIIVFVGISANAQTVHSLGLGTFATMPMVVGSHPYADNEELVIRVSPFVNYTLEYNWWNFTVGVGNWNSTFMYQVEFDSTFNNPTGGEGTAIYGFNYAFMPIAVGANVVTNPKLEVVAEVIGLLRYLHLLNFDIESDNPNIAKAVRQFRGGELDNAGYRIFGTSVGGGLYASLNLGKFMPKLQAGYLIDVNNVYKSRSENYKFRHPYVAFSINYILKYTEKLQPHDRRVKW